MIELRAVVNDRDPAGVELVDRISIEGRVWHRRRECSLDVGEQRDGMPAQGQGLQDIGNF